MSNTKYSPEQLADRWMDQREVQNLMGRYVSAKMLRKDRTMFDFFWCKEATPVLGVNDGYYVGGEAVRGYYEGLYENYD